MAVDVVVGLAHAVDGALDGVARVVYYDTVGKALILVMGVDQGGRGVYMRGCMPCVTMDPTSLMVSCRLPSPVIRMVRPLGLLLSASCISARAMSAPKAAGVAHPMLP